MGGSPATAAVRLIEMCQAVGRRVPWWTQGPGSNISSKVDGALLVKATGVRLRDVGPPPSLASLELAPLQRRLQTLAAKGPVDADAADADYRAALRECGLAETHPLAAHASGRPSMETGMHASLPGRDVLHLHALCAIALANEKVEHRGAAAALARNHGLTIAFVPPTVPGWPLCAEIMRAPQSDALLLQNHGLVLQGDGPLLLQKWTALEEEWLTKGPAHFASFSHDDAMAGDFLWRSAPLRPLLPDMAVFWQQLQAITRAAPPPSSSARQLCPSVDDHEIDARELWAAAVALETMAPDLPPLPADHVARVQTLPQEQERVRAIEERR